MFFWVSRLRYICIKSMYLFFFCVYMWKVGVFKYPFSRSPVWSPDSEVFVLHVCFHCFRVKQTGKTTTESLFCPVALSCKRHLSLFFKLLCGTLVLYLYVCPCDVIFLFLHVDELADSVSTEQEPAPSSVKELLNRLSCCRPLPQLFSPSFSSLHAVKLLVNEIVTIVVSVYALVLHVHMYM